MSEDNSVHMINFIDKYIGFYFDGGFDQMIVEAQLDHKEIQGWASIAMLYKIGTEFISIEKKEEDDIFSLIENLFITCGVEIEMEGSLANLDLSDIGCGFEFEINKYNTVLSKALDAIHKHGLSLYELINE